MALPFSAEEALDVFDFTNYSFGQYKKNELTADSIVRQTFPLKEGVDGDKIIYKVVKGCGNCTTAKYNPDTNSVDVEVDLNKLPTNVAGVGTSVVSVYLNVSQEGTDELAPLPAEIVDPVTKIATPNREGKDVIQLTVTGGIR